MDKRYEEVMTELCNVTPRGMGFIIMNLSNHFYEAYMRRNPGNDRVQAKIDALRKLLQFQDRQVLCDLYDDWDYNTGTFQLHGKYGFVNENSGLMEVLPGFPSDKEMLEVIY